MKKIIRNIIFIIPFLISNISYSIHVEYLVNDKVVDYLFDHDFQKLENNLLNLNSKDELVNKKIYFNLLKGTKIENNIEKNKQYANILLEKYKVKIDEISNYIIDKDYFLDILDISYKQKKITKNEYIKTLISELDEESRIDTSIQINEAIHSKVVKLFIEGAEIEILEDFGVLTPLDNDEFIKSYNEIMDSKLSDKKKNYVNKYIFFYFSDEEISELLNLGFKFRIQTNEFLEEYFYDDYMYPQIIDFIGIEQIDTKKIYEISNQNIKTYSFLLKNMVTEAEKIKDTIYFVKLLVSIYKNNRIEMIDNFENVVKEYDSINVVNSICFYLKKLKTSKEIFNRVERLLVSYEERLIYNYYLNYDTSIIENYLREGNYSSDFYNVVTLKLGIWIQ
ncbi:hypothetical protein HP397_03755 [Streptobacillus felis]|uniref:Uncharacterized protein n=1 Tax=Streptobacillus felis TaxID=1384509 RepID=A0A7Z0TAE9_9FUSO|nr:hypothetical protein [Streptobacillus felis]NYV27935.1 hypothetical protein [Streptobacillus felis]